MGFATSSTSDNTINGIWLKIRNIILAVVLALSFIFILYPSNRVSSNDSIQALDRGEALYENVNPGFQVLLGDRDNPGKPEVTYELSDDSDKAITLSLREVQDIYRNKTIPPFSTNPKMINSQKDKLIYEEVLPGIDISYEITSGRGLKEEISA